MSNFKCEKCGMTNIDCGKQGYKTEREIELEKQLDREKHINEKLKSALEDYANHDNWYNSLEWNTYDKQGCETAEETLKEIKDNFKKRIEHITSKKMIVPKIKTIKTF